MNKYSDILDKYQTEVEAALEGFSSARHDTREGWLHEASLLLKPMFSKLDMAYPETIRFSCGLGDNKATAGKVLGECFYGEHTIDGACNLNISPIADNPLVVLSTLVHELCHAVLPTGSGHKKNPFGRLARELGLEGKLTATYAGEELVTRLLDVISDLGPYPHGAILVKERSEGAPKPQTNRQIKMKCVCGYICRAARKWIEEVGTPTCACGEKMVCLLPDGEKPPEAPEEEPEEGEEGEEE